MNTHARAQAHMSTHDRAQARKSTEQNLVALRKFDHADLRGPDLAEAKQLIKGITVQCPVENSDYSVTADFRTIHKFVQTDYSVDDPKYMLPMDYSTRMMRPVVYHSYKEWENTPALWDPPITITVKPACAKNMRQRSATGHEKKHQSRAYINAEVAAKRARRPTDLPSRPSGEDPSAASSSSPQLALENRPTGKAKGKRDRSVGRNRSQSRDTPNRPFGKGKKGSDKGKTRGKSPAARGKKGGKKGKW